MARATENARYLFPSIDGSELTSRWDIQETPPDILVSNLSMLSTMLAREVDEPIFQRTREPPLANDEACFFLVLMSSTSSAVRRYRDGLSAAAAGGPARAHSA